MSRGSGIREGISYGFPPVTLFHNFIDLLSRLVIKKPDELDKWIAFIQRKSDHRLPLFGMLLLKYGNIEAAQTVLLRCLNLKKDTFILSNYYFQKKAEVLYKLGRHEETSKILGRLGVDPKQFSGTWPLDREGNFEKLLHLGDIKKIQQEIDSGLQNLHSQFIGTFLEKIIQDSPPNGVKEHIWANTKSYLDQKLSDLKTSITPTSLTPTYKTPLGGFSWDFDNLIRFLINLIRLEKPLEVKPVALSILATLQTGVEKLGASDYIESLEFSPEAKNPFDHSFFFKLFPSKQPRARVIYDFLFHFRLTMNNPKIHMSQLYSLYQKWKVLAKQGDYSKYWLNIEFPFAYKQLSRIFFLLGDKNHARICSVNAKTLHSLRIQESLKEPIIMLDFEWYQNLCYQIDTELVFHSSQYLYNLDKNYPFFLYAVLDSVPEKYHGQLAGTFITIFRRLFRLES